MLTAHDAECYTEKSHVSEVECCLKEPVHPTVVTHMLIHFHQYENIHTVTMLLDNNTNY